MRILGVFLLLFSSSLLAENNCQNAITTHETSECLAKQLEQKEVELQHYLLEAIARYADDDLIIESLETAQQSWLAYRKEQCNSIYTIWRDGSIRSIMNYDCSIRMTQLRTNHIWHSYLNYMDSTPPVLAEPQIND